MGILTYSGNRKIVSLDRNILVILNIGSASRRNNGEKMLEIFDVNYNLLTEKKQKNYLR